MNFLFYLLELVRLGEQTEYDVRLHLVLRFLSNAVEIQTPDMHTLRYNAA